jgi:uncharacterized protein YdhG (YjbR/CyaY superfamily)
MKEARPKFTSIDDYIKSFSVDTQKILEQIRETIKISAPGAQETINYGIPTFTLNGNLVHFAAFTSHIGFYPTPSGISAFKTDLSAYENAKGSVKFPIDKPMPLELITKIVQFRVEENLGKGKKK